jgi:2',3'-cyclic-nucleotide 2'-phosphodiesterase (5'-nucleotidase family)
MKRARLILLAGLLGATLSAAPPLAAQAGPDGWKRRVTVIVTSGLSGRLVQWGGEEETVARLTSTLRRLEREARAAGDDVLIFDAGITLAPFAESRFDQGRTMLGALSAAGTAAFAPGRLDLSVGMPVLSAQGEESRFPFLLTNVARDDGSPWPGFAHQAVFHLDWGLEIRILNLLDPGFAGDLAAAGVEGVRPSSVEKAIQAHVSPGVVTLAVLHSARRSRAVASRALAWSLLEQADGAQLYLEPDMGRDLVARSEGRDGPTFLVGRALRQAGWAPLVLRLELLRVGEGWRPVDLTVRTVEEDALEAPDPAVESEVRFLVEAFKDRYDVPLPPGAPATRGELTDFVLDAMREAARAEVAVINRGALRPVAEGRLQEGGLTREAVLRLLSLDQTVETVTLAGAQIQALVQESLRRHEADGEPGPDTLVFRGLSYELVGRPPTASISDLRVNGRPIRPGDTYRVATTHYLTSGGDGYPILTGARARPLPDASGEPLELRDGIVMLRLLEPQRPFPDLVRRPLWRYGADRIGLSFDGVKTRRDPSYESVSDSKARAEDSASFLGELRLRAERERSGRLWENRLKAVYGLVDTSGVAVRELDDDLQVDSSIVFIDRRVLGGGRPYGSVKLDSEFRPNRDAEGNRLDRQFEATLSSGVDWTFPTWPRLRLGFVLRRDYAAETRPNQYGLEFEVTHARPPSGSRPGIEARLFYENVRNDERRLQRADLDTRLLFPVWGPLIFTPAVNLYLYDDSNLPGSSRYARVSLGFAYSWQGKRQVF